MIGLPYLMLRLHDTATGTVRPLELRDPGHVSMYVCGPTVYDLPHLGHGRYSLVFDVLRRYLVFSGLDVHYVSNVTDIDDNIIDRAARDGRTEQDVTAEYEGEWWKAMDGLGVLRPGDTPHATAYVAAMVGLIGELVERGVAYAISDGVYLNVEQVPGYGLLAQQPLDSLRAGARVEGSRRSGPRWTSRCGRRPSRASRRGRRPGARAGPAGTPSAWPCRSTSWVTGSTCTAAAGPGLPPPRERAGPGGGRRSALRPALGPQRLGGGGRREDVQVPRATSPH